MTREWKPGDVAMVECSDGEWRRATCEPHASYAGLVWRFPDRVYRHLNNGPARPLVVIDPEDGQAVERLAANYENDPEPGLYAVNQMQAALREFANPTPPKPDEPMGLGAVVEDADGHKWIRQGDGPAAWMLAGASPGNRETYPYADVAAVRILSEGVQP